MLWRTTGDVKWRERGYAIFKAINEHTRTEYGFSPIHGVDGGVAHLDDMPRCGQLLCSLPPKLSQ